MLGSPDLDGDLHPAAPLLFCSAWFAVAPVGNEKRLVLPVRAACPAEPEKAVR